MLNVTSFKYYCNMWCWFVGFIMENQFIPDVFFHLILTWRKFPIFWSIFNASVFVYALSLPM